MASVCKLITAWAGVCSFIDSAAWTNASCWTAGAPTSDSFVNFDKQPVVVNDTTLVATVCGALVSAPVVFAGGALLVGPGGLTVASSLQLAAATPGATPPALAALPANAALRALGLRECAQLPVGFFPRICTADGAGINVTNGGALSVLGNYSSVFAQIYVAAGGSYTTSGFDWSIVDVAGAMNVRNGYSHGVIRVASTGHLTVSGLSVFDEWAAYETAVPQQVTAPWITNNGVAEISTGYTRGTSYKYAGDVSGSYCAQVVNEVSGTLYFSTDVQPTVDLVYLAIRNKGLLLLNGNWNQMLYADLVNEGSITCMAGAWWIMSYSGPGALHTVGNCYVSMQASPVPCHVTGKVAAPRSGVSTNVSSQRSLAVGKSVDVALVDTLNMGAQMRALHTAISEPERDETRVLGLPKGATQPTRWRGVVRVAPRHFMVPDGATAVLTEADAVALGAGTLEVWGTLHIDGSAEGGVVVEMPRKVTNYGEVKVTAAIVFLHSLHGSGTVTLLRGAQLRLLSPIPAPAAQLALDVGARPAESGEQRAARTLLLESDEAPHWSRGTPAHPDAAARNATPCFPPWQYKWYFSCESALAAGPLGSAALRDAASARPDVRRRAALRTRDTLQGVEAVKDYAYAFDGARIGGDGTGHVVVTNALWLGTRGLHVTAGRVFFVPAEASTLRGPGALEIGSGATVSAVTGVVLAGGGALRVLPGASFEVGRVADVRVYDFALEVADGATFKVDGALYCGAAARVRVCTTATGAGIVNIAPSAAARALSC